MKFDAMKGLQECAELKGVPDMSRDPWSWGIMSQMEFEAGGQL